MQFTSVQKRAAAWVAIAILFLLALWQLGPVLTPFVVAAVLAYALTPLVNKLDRLGRGHVPRALAVLLVGKAPHARVYVPALLRTDVHVGDAARVFIEGREKFYEGKVRMVRSEPSYTPYYALIGADAARLSYLAEVQLEDAAVELPAGLPARVEFSGAAQ